jgi:hypothetical protein
VRPVWDGPEPGRAHVFTLLSLVSDRERLGLALQRLRFGDPSRAPNDHVVIPRGPTPR